MAQIFCGFGCRFSCDKLTLLFNVVWAERGVKLEIVSVGGSCDPCSS